jgi:transposase-like protein
LVPERVVRGFNSLLELVDAFPNEQACIDHLRGIRWAGGSFCPYCGSTRVYDFSDKRTHKCGDCRQRFSIKVGTVFEDSKLPLRKWFMAIWLMTSHKKGIASTQLAKDLRVTQKTAWFVLHRLRYAAAQKGFSEPMTGEVAVDETAIGGLEKNKHAHKRKHVGRGLVGKMIVMGLVAKNGEVRAGVIQRTDSKTLNGVIDANVAPGSVVVTDTYLGYSKLAPHFVHKTVNHRAGEYVSPEGHTTNPVEALWSLFKRQYHGTHHWISAKHLDRYVGEMAYRLNRRDLLEGERVNDLISQTCGRRLKYKELIA